MRDYLNIAADHDELEQPCESGVLRISKRTDEAWTDTDWALFEGQASHCDREASTRPAPPPSDDEQVEKLLEQLASLDSMKRRVETRLAELGAAIHGGAS